MPIRPVARSWKDCSRNTGVKRALARRCAISTTVSYATGRHPFPFSDLNCSRTSRSRWLRFAPAPATEPAATMKCGFLRIDCVRVHRASPDRAAVVTIHRSGREKQQAQSSSGSCLADAGGGQDSNWRAGALFYRTTKRLLAINSNVADCLHLSELNGRLPCAV